MEKISYQQFKELYTENEYQRKELENIGIEIETIRQILIRRLVEKPLALDKLLDSIPSQYKWIQVRLGINGILGGCKDIEKRYDQDGELYYDLTTKVKK